MISVVITTRNDECTIAGCLDSVVRQVTGTAHEIIVLDDASEDRTPAIVTERFPGVRLIRESQRVGWVVILRRHLSELGGDGVAFLGSHCTADPDWLQTVETLMGADMDLACGFGRHGQGRWLDRFEALSMHPEYLAGQPGEVRILWDDNFVIRRDLLAQALPTTSLALSDGTGATLLSRCLRAMGHILLYRPELRITHAGASLGELLRMWGCDMARNAVDIRQADATMPLSRVLKWGPLAAFPIATGRWAHGLKAMTEAHRNLGIGLLELILQGLFFTVVMTVYALGLLRCLSFPKQISP